MSEQMVNQIADARRHYVERIAELEAERNHYANEAAARAKQLELYQQEGLYTDENQTTWTRPTAYAYAKVCGQRDRIEAERNALLAEAAEMREALSRVPELRKHGVYFDKPHTPSSIRGIEHALVVELVEKAESALTAPATEAALERVRREAQTEVLSTVLEMRRWSLRDFQGSPIYEYIHESDIAKYRASIEKQAAELRGVE